MPIQGTYMTISRYVCHCGSIVFTVIVTAIRNFVSGFTKSAGHTEDEITRTTEPIGRAIDAAQEKLATVGRIAFQSLWFAIWNRQWICNNSECAFHSE